MNLINRVIVLVALVAAMALAVLSALFVVYYPFLPRGSVAGLREFLGQLEKAQGFHPLFVVTTVVVALATLIVGLILLWFEIAPRGAAAVRLPQVRSATAQLTTLAIAQRIQAEVEQLEGVQQARPAITGRGDRVDIVLDLRAGASVSPSLKSDEVGKKVREVVEGALGVRVGQLRIKVSLEPPKPAPSAAAAAEVSAFVPFPAPAVPDVPTLATTEPIMVPDVLPGETAPEPRRTSGAADQQTP